jgi:hypothetical protein
MRYFLNSCRLPHKTLKQSGFALLAFSCAFGSGLTLLNPAVADPGHDHAMPEATADNSHGSIDHHHGMMEVPTGLPIPSVAIQVYPDPVSGWNLEIQTTNFRFAPENVNQANQPNQGHGHLYINGEKVSRVYGSWLHLPELPSGRNQITVGLNANNHATLTHNGSPIDSTVVVEVPPD